MHGRQERLRVTRWTLMSGLSLMALLGFAGCRPVVYQPTPPYKGTDPAGLDEYKRSLLFSQIVDDGRNVEECAILEGKAYKYFLRLCSQSTEGELFKKQDKSASHERLLEQPNIYRGHAIYRRGVVIEVQKAELSSEYKLQDFYVLPAIMLLDTGEVLELRILSKKKSDMYARLKQGIDDNKNPVVDVAGFFMKCHAKQTSKKGERPWRVPLVVCPDPDIFGIVGTVDVRKKALESKIQLDDYLPSLTIDAPKAEERLVVEVHPTTPGSPTARYEVDGGEFTLDASGKDKLRIAVRELLERLPEEHRKAPSAVIVIKADASTTAGLKVRDTLAEMGVTRVFMKDDAEKFENGPILR